MPHLALYLLGPPRLERDGQPIEITRRKAVALLAYLAVTGERHSRDSLAALLWPEYDHRRARADLRRTLSVLNRALDGEWLVTDQDMVGLNRQADFWLDMTYFQRRLAECQRHGHAPTEVCAACLPPLTDAVSIYRDDFLAGFTLPDSANFDEWQFFQTERLHNDLGQALEHLVYCHTSLGEIDTALTYAQRWVEFDPLHEPAHRQLMRLYAQMNQRAAALRQYQLCLQTLKEEMNLEPAAETTALYEQIRLGELASHNTPPDAVALALPATPLHNLPVQATPFIGRNSELSNIAQRLAAPVCHLLTLIGPGGVGKTRLAIEAANQALTDNHFPDGIFFVPLASSGRTDFLVSAIGQALKLSFYGPESFAENPTDQLLNYLRDRHILLVLDNFEYLLTSETGQANGGVDMLVELIQTAPGIKILVTSQERLNLQAEWVLEIHGMRLPAEDETENLEAYSSVRLFLQNARRVQADFTLTEQDKPHLIRICQLMGGMPLGLQLAAAWVRQLSCQEIAQEIENNLDFLATSQRDVPERHRSLRAVFTHSWNLLSDEEQRVYRQLSVFQGGFKRSAAEQVAGASLPVLSALTDKSFLHKQASGRYEVHQVLRQYSAELLHEHPEEEEATQNRACAYYIAFIQAKAPALKGHKQKETLREIGEEIENLQANWRWAVQKGQLTAIEQFVDGLYHFYEMRGWVPEGVAAFGRALEALSDRCYAEDTPPETLELAMAKVMARQGALCLRVGATDKAYNLLQDSLTIFRRLNESGEIAFALNYLGSVARLQGDYEQTKALWHEGLAIFRELGDRWGVAWSLNFLGHLTAEQGDYLTAKQLLQESLEIHRRLGNQRGMAGALNSLGYTLYLLGEKEEARPLFVQALAIRREIGYRRGIAISLSHLGRVAGDLNELEESKNYLYEALKTVMDIRAIPLAIDVLVALAATLAKEGQTRQAVKLLEISLHHPAAGQEARDRAEQMLTRLNSSGASQAINQDAAKQFEILVSALLANYAT